jgi:hypothetical protein
MIEEKRKFHDTIIMKTINDWITAIKKQPQTIAYIFIVSSHIAVPIVSPPGHLCRFGAIFRRQWR